MRAVAGDIVLNVNVYRVYSIDKKLCSRRTAGGHCIHQLLRTFKTLSMKLHSSQSVFSLPRCHYNSNKNILLFCVICLKWHINM